MNGMISSITALTNAHFAFFPIQTKVIPLCGYSWFLLSQVLNVSHFELQVLCCQLSAFLVCQMIMNATDGFILLTAPQTDKLVVDIPSVVVTIGLLAGHPLLVPVAANCVVEMVMHP